MLPVIPRSRKTKEFATNAAYSQNDSTAIFPFVEMAPRGPRFPRIRPAVKVASTPENPPAGAISVAAKATENHTDREFAGREVRGSDGKKLGRVKDLLIDQHSGKIVYAVISSGGLAGIRATLRVAPFMALEPDKTRSHDFTLKMKPLR